MSVRVNLLPQETADRQRTNRANVGIAGGIVVLLVLVAGLWWFMDSQVDEVNAELAAEEQTLQTLHADLASLSEFEELSRRSDEAQEDVVTMLSGEVSLAGLMQDVAAVMPTDIELQALNVNVDVASEASLGDTRPPIGSTSMSGRTLRGHAPGVERLLLELDKLAGLDDLFMASSTLEENELVDGEVAAFSVEADLGRELLTRRYVSGLPEALR